MGRHLFPNADQEVVNRLDRLIAKHGPGDRAAGVADPD
jgi:hypothetical protein